MPENKPMHIRVFRLPYYAADCPNCESLMELPERPEIGSEVECEECGHIFTVNEVSDE